MNSPWCSLQYFPALQMKQVVPGISLLLTITSERGTFILNFRLLYMLLLTSSLCEEKNFLISNRFNCYSGVIISA